MRLWALLAAILMSAAAAAQPRSLTPDDVELLEASREMSYLAGFFACRNCSTNGIAPSPDEVAANYCALNAAIQTFSRLAPADDVEIALRRAQLVYRELKTPEPAALQFVGVDADHRRNPRLTAALASSLAADFRSTANDRTVGAKFSAIRDNAELYGGVRAPANGIDFLRNVKWLIDHGSLLRRDFYTAENMERFFGIDAVPLRYASNGLEVRSKSPERADEPRCEYRLRRYESDGKPKAFFMIDCAYGKRSMPTFDEVEAVFGNGWKDGVRVFGLSPHYPGPPPARARHGNQSMAYDLTNERRTRIVISFDPDANLAHLRVEEGER